MVNELHLFITPSQGAFISGRVVLVTEEAKKNYTYIQVALKVYADVRWTEFDSETNHDSSVTSHEEYIHQTVIVWNKENAPNHELSPGFYQFSFDLNLQSSGRSLPPSFEGTYGCIRYEIEATIFTASAKKQNKRLSTRVDVAPIVDPNTIPGVSLPKVLQVEKRFCCLWCASGPITLRACLPRTGYCIVQDAITFEVDIDNGSNRSIRKLVARLLRLVVYTAQGHHRYDTQTLAMVASNPIEPGISRFWRPSLPVPATVPTTTSFCIVKVKYYLKIQACISGSHTSNPHVDFDLFFGNVPLSGIEVAIDQSPRPGKVHIGYC